MECIFFWGGGIPPSYTIIIDIPTKDLLFSYKLTVINRGLYDISILSQPTSTINKFNEYIFNSVYQ